MRKTNTTGRLLGLVLALMLVLGSLPIAEAAETARIEGRYYNGRAPSIQKLEEPRWGVIDLEEHLFIAKDLTLNGIAGYYRLDFSIPRTWKPVDGSKLELVLSHSPSLIPALSSARVILNGTVIYTVRLDEGNQLATKYIIEIPTDQLKEFNALELVANQHYMIECEDPFDPTLWTAVSKNSKIHVHYRPVAPFVDLAAYPYPIFDEWDFSRTMLHFVLPSQPSAQTLRSIARLQVALGRQINWRKVDFDVTTVTPTTYNGHTVLVGTPDENPAIMALMDLPPEKQFPLMLERGRGFSTPGGTRVGDSEGVLIFTYHPENPDLSLLIVSGNTPAGVEKAIEALAVLPYERGINGQALVVQSVQPRPQVEERIKETHIPLKDEFTLEEIGFDDLTVRGFYASPIMLDLLEHADAHPVDFKQKFKLVYSYGAQLQNRLSSLEIVFNGVSIGSKNLNNPEGENLAELTVDIPARLIAPHNRLVIRFHLYPDNFFYCGRTGDRHLWATVHKTSTLTMPRNFYTHLPDLGLLRYEWFPYTMYQDLQQTTIVVPDHPSAMDWAGLLTVSNELGRATISDGILLDAYTFSNLPSEAKANDHLIVIDSSPSAEVVKKLVGNTRLYYNSETNRVMKTIEDRELKSIHFATAGIIEQIVSPFNEERTVLLLRGQDDESLKQALESVADPAKRAKLEDNLAFAYSDENLKSVKTADKKLFGKLPVKEETQRWVYLNFWQTALLIIVAFILIYIIVAVIRLIARRRRESRRRISDKDLR